MTLRIIWESVGKRRAFLGEHDHRPFIGFWHVPPEYGSGFEIWVGSLVVSVES